MKERNGMRIKRRPAATFHITASHTAAKRLQYAYFEEALKRRFFSSSLNDA